MDRYENTAYSAGASPDDTWLFVQAVLGNRIPDPSVAARRARADREQLEWLALISDEHEGKLRALLREEAEARELLRRRERFSEDWTSQEQWDPSKHPRQGGPPNAGWFASTGGGGGSSGGAGRSGLIDGPNEDDRRAPPQDMLDLAHAWWQTKKALHQSRRDIENLPGRVASERAQVGSGGRYAYIHTQNLAKAEQDLETAKSLVPRLEKQLGDLHQQYRDSGYDDVDYTRMSPGEHWVGGKGIENVGQAVAKGGSPAGPRPTGDEFEVVSAALAGPAVLGLGKAVLGRALAKQVTSVPKLVTFVPGGKTTGVFRTASGDIPLISGRTGPAASLPKGTPGFNAITSTHVEGHAAAIMRQHGPKEATIHINNPQICLPCQQNLAHMLPPGGKLTVVLPDGTSRVFIGNAR